MRRALAYALLLLLAIALLLQQGYLHLTAAPAPADFMSFKDVSSAAGVMDNRLPGIETISGQAWGDYDNDGWVDLYVTDPVGPNTLYHNNGNGSFSVSQLAPAVALPRAYSQGAIFADYDNDGWKDLFVAGWGPNTLFRNEAGRAFVDVTRAVGLPEDSANSKTASWGDFDNDGYLDLYIANWSCYPKCGRPMEGESDRLYHNNGDGTFADVTDLLGGSTTGAGFVASFTDFDNDGDSDIYLVNDEFVNPVGNKLWRNDGPGCNGWCFTQVAREAGADTKVFGMGLATGDYDNDGDADFFFSNVGPMTLLQQTTGTFHDVAAASGVQGASFIGWGSVFLDYDNDGWRDLYLAVADTANHKDIGANQLFHNQGDGTFAAVTCNTEATDVRMSIGVASADYDRDGWVDLLVGNLDEGYRLYQNQGAGTGANHWLALELAGGGPVNRDAVGARVEVSAGGLRQVQEVVAGASVGSGNELALYFGLGPAQLADLVVRWPDGTEQAFAGVAADQRYRLQYPANSATMPIPVPGQDTDQARPTSPLLSLPAAGWLALLAALGALAALVDQGIQSASNAPKPDQPGSTPLSHILAAASVLALATGAILAGQQAGLPGRVLPNLDSRLGYLLAEAGVRPPTSSPAASSDLVKLGEALFWDPELSGNRDIACATCHLPTVGTGDGLAVSIGTNGRGLGSARQKEAARELVPRNAQPLFNLGYPQWQALFWDGRVAVGEKGLIISPASDRLPGGLDNLLAAQAMFPVTSRDEMRGNRGDQDIFGQRNELAMIDDYTSGAIWRALMQRLLAIPEYVELFGAAFPDTLPQELGFEQAANAIGAYERAALTFEDSPFDRYIRGDRDALSAQAKRGALLFYGKAQCASCHGGSLLTDQAYHNLAVPQIGDGKGREQPYDLGRARETGNDCDRYAFRTPPLRNVVLTGPYMHNGAFTSLEGAVKHHFDPVAGLQSYDASQLSDLMADRAHNGPEEQAAILQWYRPVATDGLQLSEEEMADLLAFLDALTSPSARDLGHLTPAAVPSGLTVGGF